MQHCCEFQAAHFSTLNTAKTVRLNAKYVCRKYVFTCPQDICQDDADATDWFRLLMNSLVDYSQKSRPQFPK